jgi:hypothetical protein
MWRTDKYGRLIDGPDPKVIAEMFYPVRCTHCRKIYDAGKVEVTARYTDCSMWKAPCCGRTVDDRGKGWKSRPDIEPLR